MVNAGYCVRCRKKVEMADAREVTLKNGRHAVQGVCPDCGTKIFKMGKLKGALIPRPDKTIEEEFRELSEQYLELEEKYARLDDEHERLRKFAEDRGDFVIYRDEYERLLADSEALASLKRTTEVDVAFYNLTVGQRNRAWKTIEAHQEEISRLRQEVKELEGEQE